MNNSLQITKIIIIGVTKPEIQIDPIQPNINLNVAQVNPTPIPNAPF